MEKDKTNGNEIFEKFLWGIVVAIVLVVGFGRHRVSAVAVAVPRLRLVSKPP
jgi:hypothetical protein